MSLCDCEWLDATASPARKSSGVAVVRSPISSGFYKQQLTRYELQTILKTLKYIIMYTI
ncbi:hypothetical protein SAMN03080615_00034 [Amphritea atlantica]|uniref:Uncharacterized protein n=1 Tax=Amphritea atlantica TaxID=355243 RepID=A0A1H9CKR5_9GAMM|nr:hypothetical protein SAMN03080615_00034 [Amphritea atlantica]